MLSINNPPTLGTVEKKEVPTAQLILSGQPYRLFIESRRAEKTKEAYSSSLKAFMLFRNLYDVEALVTEDPKRAQQYIIDFLLVLKEKGLSWQTRVIRAAALKHFYEMNGHILVFFLLGKRNLMIVRNTDFMCLKKFCTSYFA